MSSRGEGSARAGGDRGKNKKFEGKCYNCGKIGHKLSSCWSRKKTMESNTATFKYEEEWYVEADFVTEGEENASTTMTSNQIDYKNDWIIDSGCSNHITRRS